MTCGQTLSRREDAPGYHQRSGKLLIFTKLHDNSNYLRRHSRESGNPEQVHEHHWIPAFAALEKLVDRTDARMAGAGVGRGDRVAILCGECIEKLILMFATWRCGASACPFHAEIAPARLRAILQT